MEELNVRIYELKTAGFDRPFYFEVNPRIAEGEEKTLIKKAAKEFLNTEKGKKFIAKYDELTWHDIFEIPNDIYQKFGLKFLEQPLQIVSETVENTDLVLDSNNNLDNLKCR